MKGFITLLFFCCAVSAWTASNNRLNNGDLAYYGEDFYRRAFHNKHELFDILNSRHQSTQSYDEIGQCHSSHCYGHTPLSYKEARETIYYKLDRRLDQSGHFIEDVYCEKKVYYRGQTHGAPEGINTEHTWPQSKFTRSFSKSMQKSDLHHLYPTDMDANSRRGNFPFGDYQDGEQDYLNLSRCDNSHLSENRFGDRTFTPPFEHRGNVARALFYFSVRYKMPISIEQEVVLRLWHTLDPVDQAEKERNNKIAQIQFTRNPFVDFPQLVDDISDF